MHGMRKATKSGVKALKDAKRHLTSNVPRLHIAYHRIGHYYVVPMREPLYARGSIDRCAKEI